MRDTYNQLFLENTLYVLTRDLQDLEVWSVYNNDEKSDEIQQIKELVDLLTEQLTK